MQQVLSSLSGKNHRPERMRLRKCLFNRFTPAAEAIGWRRSLSAAGDQSGNRVSRAVCPRRIRRTIVILSRMKHVGGACEAVRADSPSNRSVRRRVSRLLQRRLILDRRTSVLLKTSVLEIISRAVYPAKRDASKSGLSGRNLARRNSQSLKAELFSSSSLSVLFPG